MDDAQTDADPRIGEVLEGRYRIIERVGGGAMAEVYRAERIGLGREVAVKFLHAKLASDGAWVKRFEREAQAMSRLSHPHCVSVIDFGVAQTPYIVMDFVTGKTLRELMDEGRVPFDRAIELMRQVLAGLAHAHEHGIVHRDIKPANIVLTDATGKGDHVQVVDFGLARLAEDGTGRAPTTSKLVIGTPNYMAPEQARAKKVDARCDVYSAGVVLFELLTGEKPYEAKGTFEVLRMHQDDPIPSIGTITEDSGVARALDAIVAKAMAKKPANRFESAMSFAAALDHALEHRDEETRGSSGRRRSITPIMLALIVFAAGGVAGAWYLERGMSEPDESGDAHMTDNSAEPLGRQGAIERLATAETDAFDASVESADPFDAGSESADLVGNDAGAGDEEVLDDEVSDEVGDESGDEFGEVIDDEIDAMEILPDPPDAGAGAGAPARPARVDRIADARSLIAQGRRNEAIAGLVVLRRQQPKNGFIHYLLGNLYFEKKWWTVGLNAYRLALKYKPKYRSYATINNNAIRALASPKSSRNAAGLLRNSIGKSALPFLRRAARTDRNITVRKRAASLIKQISKRR